MVKEVVVEKAVEAAIPALVSKTAAAAASKHTVYLAGNDEALLLPGTFAYWLRCPQEKVEELFGAGLRYAKGDSAKILFSVYGFNGENIKTLPFYSDYIYLKRASYKRKKLVYFTLKEVMFHYLPFAGKRVNVCETLGDLCALHKRSVAVSSVFSIEPLWYVNIANASVPCKQLHYHIARVGSDFASVTSAAACS